MALQEETRTYGEAVSPAFDGVVIAPDAWIHKDDTSRALAVILSGFATLVFAVLTTIALFAAAPGTRLATAVAVVGMLAALTGAFAWLAYRLLAAGVRIAPDEVRLRGMLRTHRIPLTEVDRFEAGVFSSVPLADEIGVRLLRHGGRDLDVWALGGGPAHGEGALEAGLSRLEPLCEELNSLLDEVRNGSAARG